MRVGGRLFTSSVVVVLALGWFPSGGATIAKPNIVVIMTDDQTVEQMQVMARTQELIGDAGATFANAYVSFPLCCPSRATFLSGQYAHNHGVLENDPPTGGHGRFDHANALPVWLQQAGYRTIHVGKYMNDYGTEDPYEIPPGWDEWRTSVDPTTYWMWGYTMNENGELKTYGEFEKEDPEFYQTDVYRDKALEAIDNAAGGDDPFFLNLWFLAPHREVFTLQRQVPPRPAPRHAGEFADVPLPKPPSFNEPDVTDKPLYIRVKPPLDDTAIGLIETRYRMERESLLAVDEAVEAIVAKLDAEGILDNTYILFVSDNGYFHGEHRTPDEKILAYEPSAKVPMMMRGPGIDPGTIVDEPVVNVDIAPTFVEVAGASSTLEMDGRSLMPFATDAGQRTTRPLLLEAFWPVGSTGRFFVEQVTNPGAEGEGGEGVPLNKAVMSYHAIHTGRYVYIEYDTGEHELYDLDVDPWQIESKHLDPAYLPTQLALFQELQRLRFCSGASCAQETDPIPDPG